MIIKPYKGNDSYLFVSYAHKDKTQAMEIIAQLISAGYRVWYDEGIDPGTEWDGNIASHLRSCDGIIALLSRNYLNSENCKDEINYARDLGKDRLLVYLEDVELPDGMAMRLGRNLAIYRDKYPDPASFFDKLTEAPMLARCRSARSSGKILTNDKSYTAYVPPVSSAARKASASAKEPPSSVSAPTSKMPLSRALGIALGALLVLGLLFSGILRGLNRAESSGESDTAAQSAPAVLSPQEKSTPLPVTQAPASPEPLSAALYEGSRGALRELPIASATATSTYKDDDYGEFPARNVLDNDVSTSWQEGVPGYGIRESITLRFSSELDLRCLELYNGNQSNEWSYRHNGRVKTALLSFSDGSFCEFTFEDTAGSTIIEFSRSVRTSYVEITILDAYEAEVADDGVEYMDTSISELHCYA